MGQSAQSNAFISESTHLASRPICIHKHLHVPGNFYGVLNVYRLIAFPFLMLKFAKSHRITGKFAQACNIRHIKTLIALIIAQYEDNVNTNVGYHFCSRYCPICARFVFFCTLCSFFLTVYCKYNGGAVESSFQLLYFNNTILIYQFI